MPREPLGLLASSSILSLPEEAFAAGIPRRKPSCVGAARVVGLRGARQVTAKRFSFQSLSQKDPGLPCCFAVPRLNQGPSLPTLRPPQGMVRKVLLPAAGCGGHPQVGGGVAGALFQWAVKQAAFHRFTLEGSSNEHQ